MASLRFHVSVEPFDEASTDLGCEETKEKRSTDGSFPGMQDDFVVWNAIRLVRTYVWSQFAGFHCLV